VYHSLLVALTHAFSGSVVRASARFSRECLPYSTKERVTVTKKTFDLALIVVLLAHPAFGLLKTASRRWAATGNGALSTIGSAVEVAL
jgi:hypothetical protein